MDGSFDGIIAEGVTPRIPEDLLEVQPFEEAMEDLRNEIEMWYS